MFTIIVACDGKNGISANGTIPWDNKKDREFFRNTTMNNIVIFGRKTYETIKQPLKNRTICIISKTLSADSTHNKHNTNNTHIFANCWSCINWCVKHARGRNIFVCGGAQIYEQFNAIAGLIRKEYISIITGNYKCDLFYDTKANAKALATRNRQYIDNTLTILTRSESYNYEENHMLHVFNYILKHGDVASNRTGVPTKCIFGTHMRFSLANNTFPLMTTRRMFLRGIFEELMFNLRGQTDTTILEKKGVNIWKTNTSREFLDSRGLSDMPVGDMGHTYGFSIRYFGADYKTCKDSYEGQGYDQLKQLISDIKHNPTSRRLIISLWEPNKQERATLPPCVYQYQFYVSGDGTRLSCMVTQRSSDIITALGWNVASCALFTILLASVCDKTPHELILNIGNAHIYENLYTAAKIQIERKPQAFPALYIKNKKKKITNYQYSDLLLVNYIAKRENEYPKDKRIDKITVN